MTVAEFSKKMEVDVTTNKSPLGNQLKADLSLQGVHIDFDKEVEDLSDEENIKLAEV